MQMDLTVFALVVYAWQGADEVERSLTAIPR